jgi:hypothetical protein
MTRRSHQNPRAASTRATYSLQANHTPPSRASPTCRPGPCGSIPPIKAAAEWYYRLHKNSTVTQSFLREQTKAYAAIFQSEEFIDVQWQLTAVFAHTCRSIDYLLLSPNGLCSNYYSEFSAYSCLAGLLANFISHTHVVDQLIWMMNSPLQLLHSEAMIRVTFNLYSGTVTQLAWWMVMSCLRHEDNMEREADHGKPFLCLLVQALFLKLTFRLCTAWSINR